MKSRSVWFLILNLTLAVRAIHAQDALRRTSTEQEQTAEAEQVIVSATRFDIPLDQ